MKKITFILFLTLTKSLWAQDIERCNCPQQMPLGKGTVYLGWGYNRDYFSKSDIHFKDSGAGDYDFTLYDLKAKDRSGIKDVFKTTLAVPQYVYRLGYYFNNKKDLGIEINFDHAKYVMVNDQVARLKGTIHGVYYDLDTLVSSGLLRFEHTNGANFLMINLLKRQNLLVSGNKKHWLSAVVKPGAGVVIPKTDVAILGDHLDNKFHIAGYIVGAEVGFRYDLYKWAYIEATGKGTFANYANVLVVGTGKAKHHFFTGQIIVTAGFQFGL